MAPQCRSNSLAVKRGCPSRAILSANSQSPAAQAPLSQPVSKRRGRSGDARLPAGSSTTACSIFIAFLLVPFLARPQSTLAIGERQANASLQIDLSAELPPPTISVSGLFSDIATQTPSPGLIPYSVNSPLWSDGTHKVRYLALPGLSQIEFSRQGRWQFPANAILVKSFYLDMVRGDPTTRQIVETRFLIKVGSSREWQGFSYRWNEAGTDAELLLAGGTSRFEVIDPEAPAGVTTVDYIFPAAEDCGQCHTPGAGYVLGMRTAQLNGVHDYGDAIAHQLRTLNRLGVFDEDIGDDFDNFPRWEDPGDTDAPLAGRARSYLASNCSHCHRPGGLRRTEIDLRYDTDLTAMGIVDVPSQLDDLDGINRRIVSPGEAQNSVLPLRMIALDKRRMPPLATGIVDTESTLLIRRWIEALGKPTHVSDFSTTPEEFALKGSFPNPFNASATLSYSLAQTGWTHLAVHDITGRKVRTLVAARRGAGPYLTHWDGLDDYGKQVASGVFLARLQTRSGTQTLKLTLLR